jgi:hypothetical protein
MMMRCTALHVEQREQRISSLTVVEILCPAYFATVMATEELPAE